MDFSISVIIPVYNCEIYIGKAIQSVLKQPEVIEVVVVNDGSTDNTLEIVQKLQIENSKIKIFHHHGKNNKGRSASRNLGILNAKGNFISFLDADDFYLENRFKNDKKIFEENSNADGVYNAIGAHFYRPFLEEEKQKLELLILRKNVVPDKLFNTLMSGDYGYFSIIGLTIKKTIIENFGGFNESLMLAEDTDFILKMALKSNLYLGVFDKPIAMRGVHTNNVFNNRQLYKIYELKMYESLYFWTIKKRIDLKIIERFLERIWIIHFKQNKNVLRYIIIWFDLTIKSLPILFTYLTIKYFPIVRLRKKLFPFLYK